MPKSFAIAIFAIIVIAVSAVLPGKSPSAKAYIYRDQVAVLMYHHLHKTDTSSSTITPDLFREQLTYLKDQGYNFISLDDFKRYMDGAPVPDNAVLVTFDDGYESLYTDGVPILKELGTPAVSFLITETFEKPLDGGIPFLSPKQIGEIAAESSLVEFGCHTNGLHRKLPNGKGALVGRTVSDAGVKETDEAYRQRVADDTSKCVAKVASASGKPVDYFAYPFGIYSAEASAILHRSGINYAFTIVGDMATRNADRMRIPRINAGSPDITPRLLDATIRQKIVATGK